MTGVQTCALPISGNLPAAKLYLKKGYKLIGETPLNLDYDIEDSFKCFEKII